MERTNCFLSSPRPDLAKEIDMLKQHYGTDTFDKCFTILTENNFTPGILLESTMRQITDNPYATGKSLRVIVRSLYLASFNIETENLSLDLVSIMARQMSTNLATRLHTFNKFPPLTQEEKNCIDMMTVLISEFYLQNLTKDYKEELCALVNTEKEDYLNKTFLRRAKLSKMTKETGIRFDKMSASELMDNLKSFDSKENTPYSIAP